MTGRVAGKTALITGAAGGLGEAMAHRMAGEGAKLALTDIDGARAEALAAARPDRAGEIERQLERLVSPDQMGELFKVACIHTPGFTAPGFEDLT